MPTFFNRKILPVVRQEDVQIPNKINATPTNIVIFKWLHWRVLSFKSPSLDQSNQVGAI